MKKLFLIFISIIVLFSCTACSLKKDEVTIEPDNDGSSYVENDVPVIEDRYEDVLVTLAGDCTLGTEPHFSDWNSLPYYVRTNGYDYIFKKVYDIFDNDDLTIVNLETTFTTSKNRKPNKTYCFKGDPEYTQILTSSSVEAVNLANNHTMDYLEEGYEDTKRYLDDADVKYFGNDIFTTYEVKGIKIGLIGISAFGTYEESKKSIDRATSYFDENPVDIRIYTFHWGAELHYKQSDYQQKVAHYAIDNGKANLIVGGHPHVLQGMETYNGVDIAYSLGNFSFGGNKNPRDKRTMILQVNFSFKNNELLEHKTTIIPALITSKKSTNNYQPMVATGSDAQDVLNRIKESSKNFEYNWKVSN